MEELLLLEQNNEKLQELLFDLFCQLDDLYEGISVKYSQFQSSITYLPIEEKSLLLMELSRQTIHLFDQNVDAVYDLVQQLLTEPASSFASILLNDVKKAPFKVFSHLKIS
jgi:hypothetical protein